MSVKITASVKDTNSKTIGLTGNSSRLIKYHSKALASMTIDADGAINLDTLVIRNGRENCYGKYSYTFNEVTSDTFTFFATDSQHNEGREIVVVDMVDYIKPTCSIANSSPDASGYMRLSCSGNYFNGSFGEENNSLTLQYSYTGTDGNNNSGYFTTNNISISDNTYTAYADLYDLDYQAVYTFVITVEDSLETVTSTKSGVTSKPIFHWGKNDFAFEVPVKFNSTGEMNFKGDLRLKGDGNYGNTLYFGDGSCCYISEPADDEMILNANNINLSATNVVAINGWSVCGTWKPELNNESFVETWEVRSGWYQRLGNVITIGWQIKAKIYSGHENALFSIENIPATPAVNAFGGGVAFGLYAPYEDYVFECWCANTNNQITARLQPCNKASDKNLNVLSDGIFYPNGGGYVTLAGTICYMIDE